MKSLRILLLFAFGFYACQPSGEQEKAVSRNPVEKNEAEIKNEAPAVKDQPDTTREIAENRLIIPGKSIGQTELEETSKAVIAKLGKPDAGDAAMGKAMNTWYAKTTDASGRKHETNMFFSHNMGAADEASRVKQIRITSGYFKTENGMGVGSKLAEIQKHYPEIKKTAVYTSPQTKPPVFIYEAAGIAFEITAENSCCGLSIYSPGKFRTEMYAALFPDF